jgi:hypothetical protein
MLSGQVVYQTGILLANDPLCSPHHGHFLEALGSHKRCYIMLNSMAAASVLESVHTDGSSLSAG